MKAYHWRFVLVRTEVLYEAHRSHMQLHEGCVKARIGVYVGRNKCVLVIALELYWALSMSC